jgi:hypothetical protein
MKDSLWMALPNMQFPFNPFSILAILSISFSFLGHPLIKTQNCAVGVRGFLSDERRELSAKIWKILCELHRNNLLVSRTFFRNPRLNLVPLFKSDLGSSIGFPQPVAHIALEAINACRVSLFTASDRKRCHDHRENG